MTRCIDKLTIIAFTALLLAVPRALDGEQAEPAAADEASEKQESDGGDKAADGDDIPLRPEAAPPPPQDGENLIRNGDFSEINEQGDGPRYWQRPDGLVMTWMDCPVDEDRGKVIRIDTDVNQSQAYRWWVERYVRGAGLDRVPDKQATRPPRYNTIAGLDGGFFWSDYIPVKPGGAYRVYVDARGGSAKVFIRGYEKKLPLSFGDEQPAVQQVFREARDEPTHDEQGRPIRYRMRYRYTTWFPVGGSDQWQTYTHIQPRHPNNREITENVRDIRIMLYAYWPPGEYWFDNVRVYEVEPAEDGNIPEGDEKDREEGRIIR